MIIISYFGFCVIKPGSATADSLLYQTMWVNLKTSEHDTGSTRRIYIIQKQHIIITQKPSILGGKNSHL